MKGRTYRYYSGPVQYPFGFGLSYTTFAFQSGNNFKTNYKSTDTLTATIQVKNTGPMNADEVVQAYIEYPNAERMPLKELKTFKRISLNKGETRETTISIPIKEFQKWDLTKHGWKIYPGDYKLVLGENSRDEKLILPFKVK